MLRKSWLFLLPLVLSGGLANAQLSSRDISPGGFFIEPAISYEIGDTKITWPSPLQNSTGSSDGIGLGLRGGIHISEIFFAGVDLRYAFTKFTDSSVNYKSDSESWNWGPFVGAQMPVAGLRVWGSYLPNAELDPKASGNFNAKFKNGNGWRLGAGFHIEMVSVNVEYQEIKYGTTTVEQIGPFATNTDFHSADLINKTWLFSVSFPIALGSY